MSTRSQTRREPLDKGQQRVVAKIRSLHAANTPLNITAICRHYPELICAVHAMKPFWSWKSALAAAGLPYSKIKRELESVCKCPFCGAEKANLGTHLLLVHDIHPQDFLLQHPDGDLTSEQLRADKSMMKSAVLAHWEPLWSREYVLDRAHEFHKRNLPLYSAWIAAHDRPFHSAGLRYFQRWSALLEAVGVDPADVARQRYLTTRRYPDPQAVIAEIRRRHRRHLLLNSSSVRPADIPRDQSFGKRERFSVSHKRPPHARTVDPPLWFCAREYFGCWSAALQAAGFDPAKIHRAAMPSAKYTTPSDIRDELRRRYRTGQSLKVADLLRSPAEDSALVAVAREYFGGWVAALQSARVPRPPRDRTHPTGPKRRYPDRPSVLKAIRQRKRSRQLLNPCAMVKGPAVDCALMRSALEFFGSWSRALAAAGLNPATILLRPGPKPRRQRTAKL